MLLSLLLIVGGVLLLYFGAEWLVGGSAGIALAFGVRQLVVGLTVVAFGTSAPELVVSVEAALAGASEIALGNVIGSNIANLALILSLSVVFNPAVVDAQIPRREVPMLLGTTVILPLLLWNGRLERAEGLLLLVIAIVYTVTMVMAARTSKTAGEAWEAAEVTAEAARAGGAPTLAGRAKLLGQVVVGLVVLVVGGKLLLQGAVDVARVAGMSEQLVGLTIVAVGTSLPELATSLLAAARGHSDIAVGNVIGSNIFNVVFCLGGAVAIVAMEQPIASVALELVALVIVTGLGALFMRTARTIQRWEGAVLLGCYGLFLVATVLRN